MDNPPKEAIPFCDWGRGCWQVSTSLRNTLMPRLKGVRRNRFSLMAFLFCPERGTFAAFCRAAPLVAEMERTQRYVLISGPVANPP